jgi:uncharacterized membrane protein YcaP (DUF421 family)
LCKAATSLELSIIAAMVLGGTSLADDKADLFGTLLGVLTLAVLNNGMTFLSLSTDYQQIIQGTVLLRAVALGQVRISGLQRNRLKMSRKYDYYIGSIRRRAVFAIRSIYSDSALGRLLKAN